MRVTRQQQQPRRLPFLLRLLLRSDRQGISLGRLFPSSTKGKDFGGGVVLSCTRKEGVGEERKREREWTRSRNKLRQKSCAERLRRRLSAAVPFRLISFFFFFSTWMCSDLLSSLSRSFPSQCGTGCSCCRCRLSSRYTLRHPAGRIGPNGLENFSSCRPVSIAVRSDDPFFCPLIKRDGFDFTD